MYVGEGDSSVGGDVIMQAGKTTDQYTGGFIDFTSGFSLPTSSGYISFVTPNAGVSGVSGHISIKTGTASYGSSGMIAIATGAATAGHGGDVRMIVGTGDSGDGGNVIVSAGETTARRRAGGSVKITAGLGSNTDRSDGGARPARGGRGTAWR